MSKQNSSKASILSSAPPFDPEEDFTEVCGHDIYVVAQNGIYYDAQGEPVDVIPPQPKIRRGMAKLRAGVNATRNNKIEGTQQRVIGNARKLPDKLVARQKEDAQALAAESSADLLD
jgi:hypothetical protein